MLACRCFFGAVRIKEAALPPATVQHRHAAATQHSFCSAPGASSVLRGDMGDTVAEILEW